MSLSLWIAAALIALLACFAHSCCRKVFLLVLSPGPAHDGLVLSICAGMFLVGLAAAAFVGLGWTASLNVRLLAMAALAAIVASYARFPRFRHTVLDVLAVSEYGRRLAAVIVPGGLLTLLLTLSLGAGTGKPDTEPPTQPEPLTNATGGGSGSTNMLAESKTGLSGDVPSSDPAPKPRTAAIVSDARGEDDAKPLRPSPMTESPIGHVPDAPALTKAPLPVRGDSSQPQPDAPTGPAQGLRSDPAPKAAFRPSVQHIVQGRVIRRSRHSDQRAVGINAAVVQAGSNDATTNSAGDFVLRLPFVPDEKDDTIVVFRHDDYMPAFRRLADLPTDGETLVEMEPKWRITVTDFNGTLPGETFQSHRAILGRSIKERLALVSEVVITADEHREAIIKKLYDYQQRRALYAKETLAEVGNMSGATIGLFGFVERLAPDAIRISCDLTDLETAEVKKSAGIVIKDLDRLDLHAERLADHLLFRLCEVHLLYPRDKALCGTVINAKGYTRFRPRGWAVSVTVQASGLDQHYPQPATDEPIDGSWSAARIHLGDGTPVETDQAFHIWPILVNRHRIAEFTENCNLSKSQSFTTWEKRFDYELFPAVAVTLARHVPEAGPRPGLAASGKGRAR